MTAAQDADRHAFEDIEYHLTKVDETLNDILDAHTRDIALNIIAAIASAQQSLRLVRRYLVPKEGT